MIMWQEWGDERIDQSPLIKPIIEFVARKEGITATINYHPDINGAYTERMQPVVFIPYGGSIKEVWEGKPHLSTLSRMRVRIIKKQDIPREMKTILCILSDILHEFGHIKYHYNKKKGISLIDKERYKEDLEYRLHIEQEAEAMTSKWFKYFGFYRFINDATKLD